MSENSRNLWQLWKEACLSRWKYAQSPSAEAWAALWRAYGAYYLALRETHPDVEPVLPPDNKEDGDTVEEPNPPPEEDEDEGSETAMKGGTMQDNNYWANQVRMEEMSRSRSDWSITNRQLNDAAQNSNNQQAMATSTAGSIAATTAVMNSIAALNGLTTFNQNAQVSSQFMNSVANPAGTATANSQMQLAASKMSELMGILGVLVASTEVAASGGAAAAAKSSSK